MRFPDGFLWGAATAGHQVEGGNVNSDCWYLEWAKGSMFAEPSGDACDHYHRYGEDVAILAGLGCNAYRFSIEWARVEPEEGFFSRAELDHYRRMLASCVEHGVTPVVTYNHFTVPRWFAAAGGWASGAAADRFARYASRVTERLGDLVPWACTLNEPNVMALLEAIRAMPTGANESGMALAAEPRRFEPEFRMGLAFADLEHVATAHRKAVDAIKSGPGDTKVGWSLALVDLQPVEGGEQRCEDARRNALTDWLEVARDDDFVGVQTYSRERIGRDGIVPAPQGAPKMQTGWEVYPEALEHTVRLAAEVARVPVLVTENGMATDDDDARLAYTKSALAGLARCIADGIDVRGYLHWTLLDNFEWMSGYAMTFGLIGVDRQTFERTVKPSARWLGQVARANALE
jgi:beta-glucosidase